MTKRIRSSKRMQHLQPDAPLLFADHAAPKTRRDFIRQGLMTGGAAVMGSGLLGLLGNRTAQAALSPDLTALLDDCGIRTAGAGKIPFICFDLAGGANIAGSNVLVGKQGGQLDFLSTAGYSKLGIPGDMIPPVADAQGVDHIDSSLGLSFHRDSAFLRGIKTVLSDEAALLINGAVIAARSENDTGNNPHNPMYAINKIGADGQLLTLIGSQSSDSGGNSMAPLAMIDSTKRPTKIDRPSDVLGLVDAGDLSALGGTQADAVAVMESIYRVTDKKMANVSTGLPTSGQALTDAVVKDLVRCGYLKSAALYDRFGNPAELNVELDSDIVGGIFTPQQFTDGEFRKTASIMKLVINGYAGAGTVTMGGFDYHTGDRSTGELRDFRAGVCMGACLEYAHRKQLPLMLYVFSDGALASNGMVDNSEEGRGKGQWTGDNQSTAATFFLVYNPNGKPQLMGATPAAQAQSQQIGYFRDSGDVETSSSPAGNNVNLLVETVALNYLALHDELGRFDALFPGSGLGSGAVRDALVAFQPIVSGTI
ncbi:general secretion pathway protein GspF [Permianibacter sp. IMCC34836]|uniref:hypothetical protein n=1 Tax=Permianibacter fluminis TaxID=2738515 RepID=UPI001B7D8008|nr:hypothetical protein [Permianibacter fluminis]NQD37278.1 general secretion pathway protein GspF [Permianibacter fluminis]